MRCAGIIGFGLIIMSLFSGCHYFALNVVYLALYSSFSAHYSHSYHYHGGFYHHRHYPRHHYRR